jgi:hypothetical protein
MNGSGPEDSARKAERIDRKKLRPQPPMQGFRRMSSFSASVVKFSRCPFYKLPASITCKPVCVHLASPVR